jgi:DnaJ family protein C protein 19
MFSSSTRRSVLSVTRHAGNSNIILSGTFSSHGRSAFSTIVTQQSPLIGASWDRRDGEKEKNQFRALALTSSLQRSLFHTTARTENVSLALALGSVALATKGAQMGVRAFKEWQENQPEVPPEAEGSTEEELRQETQADEPKASGSSRKKADDSPRENIFKKFFGMGVGNKYYEGGFDDKMTRKEAALIIGVRESASAQRIKNAHRKIMILNHPDTGGSTYITLKINEAKELLLKGKD